MDANPGYKKLKLVVKTHEGEITRIETFCTRPIENEVAAMLKLMRTQDGLDDVFTMEISNVR